MPRYDAVLFDLLTALLDSWTVWSRAAGGAEAGMRWRHRYLELTYGCGDYRPYEGLVAAAALDTGLPLTAPGALVELWHDLAPWPEVPAVLAALPSNIRTGLVTNCSAALGAAAAARLDCPIQVMVTAEQAGAYKPDPRPYRLALARLGLPASRVLFVAGSASDLPGAIGVGMPAVWHNRIDLPLPAGFPVPLETLATLADLPQIVRGNH